MAKKTTKLSCCLELANLKKKHISEVDIKSAADKFQLSYCVAERAWKNFYESAGKVVDRNDLYRNHQSTGTKFPKVRAKIKRNDVYREVSYEEARDIILEYMHTDISSRELSTKYNIAVHQLYDWMHELEVSGTLFGKKILKLTKYAKPSIINAIWLRKKPNTKRHSITRLSAGERTMLSRVADVLEQYL